MKSLLMTNEYPPNIYGGAGVHVDYLSRELAKLMPVEVRCFGDQDVPDPGLRVIGTPAPDSEMTAPAALKSVFGALDRCLDFNTRNVDAQVVHCHTWYTHWAGILAKLNYGIPLVVTVHSLEPLRPWKREQLGGGYDFSLWVEKTAIEMADAVIAVSSETKADIERLFNVDPAKVTIIYNGIDPTEYHRVEATDRLDRFGIDPGKPFILFVGRITRQKGIVHLVRAIEKMAPGFQVVLCAGAPDTPEIGAEMKAAVEAAQQTRSDIIWIGEMVDKSTAIELYSRADLFVCPSIYEPFGIINLEAMACETPVVASAVGGIKEVVVHGTTGLLVPVEQMQESPFEPLDPDKFSSDLATAVNTLMADNALRESMGHAGRQRAIDHFSWSAIAQQTHDLYASLQ